MARKPVTTQDRWTPVFTAAGVLSDRPERDESATPRFGGARRARQVQVDTVRTGSGFDEPLPVPAGPVSRCRSSTAVAIGAWLCRISSGG